MEILQAHQGIERARVGLSRLADYCHKEAHRKAQFWEEGALPHLNRVGYYSVDDQNLPEGQRRYDCMILVNGIHRYGNKNGATGPFNISSVSEQDVERLNDSLEQEMLHILTDCMMITEVCSNKIYFAPATPTEFMASQGISSLKKKSLQEIMARIQSETTKFYS